MLKFQLDSLDGLDDSVKSLYQEKDGKFQLAVEGMPDSQDEDISGLKSALQKLKSERTTLKDELKGITSELNGIKGDLGDQNIDTLKALMQSLNQDEATKLLAQGDREGAVKLLARNELAQIKELQAQLEGSQTELGKMRETNRNMQIESAFDRMVSTDGRFLGNKEGHETTRADLLGIFKSSMVVTDEGIFARDPNDPENILVDGSGKVDAVRWMDQQRTARPHFFMGQSATDHKGKAGGSPEGFSLEGVPTANKIAAARAAQAQQQ